MDAREVTVEDGLRRDLRIALDAIARLNGQLRTAETQRDAARSSLSRLNAIPRPARCEACQDAVRAGLGRVA